MLQGEKTFFSLVVLRIIWHFPKDFQQKSDLELPPVNSPECLIETVKSFEAVRSLPAPF